MLILVLVLYTLLAVYELVPLYKQKLQKDFWVTTGLLAISFVIAILLSINVRIPSPAQPIKAIVTSIFGK